MATKYWVGGTGTWDGFTATNWSDTSGGAGGAIAPCALDDVVFNSASNALAYTVTISTGAVCRDLTIAGPAVGNVTVAGSAALGIFGSLTLPATGITRTYTGAITFRATTTGKTITTNGVTLASAITFNGVGGKWTLQDALSTSGNITFIAGELDTDSKNFTTTGQVSASNGIASILTLGASAVSCNNWQTNNTVTLNAGTSTITNTQGGNAALGTSGFSGATYYNVVFSAAGSAPLIYGNNTFNNLTFTTPASGIPLITFDGNQTVTGTLTATGTGAVARLMLASDTVGTARTFTVGTVATLTDVDFRDITVAGASSPWSGTRLGDCGGNTNITFGAGVNKYWNLPAGGAWTAAAWATSSGGTADVLNFPLAQDTVIIENTGLNTSASITGFSGFNLKTLDCSTRSNAATLSGNNCRIYDDVTLSTAMTVNGLSVRFEGRTTQTITSAGKTLSNILVNNSGSTVTLADALSCGGISHSSGTFDTANQSVTSSGGIAASGTSAKTLTLGSSTISCTSWSGTNIGTSLTLNAGTSSITGNANSFGFSGTFTYYNVTLPSSAFGDLIGTNTYNNLTFSSAATTTGTNQRQIRSNQTINGTLALAGGASITQRLWLIGPIGSPATITAATVTGLTNIDFRDITGAGAASWTGTSLGDCGGNSGITFDTPKTVYWNLAGSNSWSATAWATGSGGSPAAANFPLAQDTVVFDDTGAVTTATINPAWNIGTINAGNRTNAMTLAGFGNSPFIHGDVTIGSGVTLSGAGNVSFNGRSTQTFISAGKTVPFSINTSIPTCTFRHGDAFTSTSGVNIGNGTYDTQNYNVTITNITASGGTINFGSSTVTLSGSGVNFSSASVTFNAGTSTINLSSTSTKSIVGAGKTFNVVTSTGGTTNALTISGSNTFNTLSNTAYTFLILTSGTTQTFTNFNYTGASGSVVRITTSTPGLQATVTKAVNPFYAGANSTDGGNNTGWTFTAGGSTDYVYLKDIIAIGGPAGSSKFFFMFGN